MTKMVQIDLSPLEPLLDADRAARITAAGANCPVAGDAPCLMTGRMVRFSLDMGDRKTGGKPSVFLSIVGEKRPTDVEVEWFFRFSNIRRGVEHPPHAKPYLRNFTIGNTGDFVTLLPGGSA